VVAVAVAAVPIAVGSTIAHAAAASIRAGGSVLHILETEEVRELVGVTILMAWLGFSFATQHAPATLDAAAAKLASPTSRAVLAARASLSRHAGLVAAGGAALAVASWAAWAQLVGSGTVHVGEHCTGMGAWAPEPAATGAA
jgi:hypothetical protein